MTTEQVRPLMARLSLAFGQPYGLTSTSADGLISVWLTAVADCEPRDVSQAIDEWIRTQKKWPAPATIRDDAMKLLRARKPAQSSNGSAFCSYCHARDLVELANGRFMPLHSDNCPGLHDADRLDLTHATATGRGIWRNGAPPQ